MQNVLWAGSLYFTTRGPSNTGMIPIHAIACITWAALGCTITQTSYFIQTHVCADYSYC